MNYTLESKRVKLVDDKKFKEATAKTYDFSWMFVASNANNFRGHSFFFDLYAKSNEYAINNCKYLLPMEGGSSQPYICVQFIARESDQLECFIVNFFFIKRKKIVY